MPDLPAGSDLLAASRWEVCSTPPGAATSPGAARDLAVEWWPATVPGTAASALRDVPGVDPDGWDYDGRDWWFRTRCRLPAGRHLLRAAGLATVSDVWLDGELLLHSENMFRRHHVEVDVDDGAHELAVRCHALGPLLEERRARPRWRTNVVTHRNLRWLRTSYLGRAPRWTLTPPLVGPWRPLELWSAGTPVVTAKQVLATCDDRGGGDVHVRLDVWGPLGEPAVLDLAGREHRLRAEDTGLGRTLAGSAHLERVERWWPATAGPQPLYPLELRAGPRRVRLSPVGFRTVEADTSGGGFALAVNGVEVFCRGAVWWPTDPLAGGSPPAELDRSLALARAANMNMLRVSGMGVYEDEAFFEGCDRLGLLVWQDCMLAFCDPPDDDSFVDEVVAELDDNLGWVGGHPSLAVLCGSQQIYEQATMISDGLDPPPIRLLDEVIPARAAELVPGTPYLPSTPQGGDAPFYVDAGTANYFGVGGFLRDPMDARHSGVRFAVECLFFATPPDPRTVDTLCGGAIRAGHDPSWKRAVHADPGRGWDMEDLRDFYVSRLFGVDPLLLRHGDPERALDVGRACNAHLVERVFGEWRRAGSVCRGGIVLGLRDQRAGAGWGLVDVTGTPKSTWYAFRRANAPVGVVLTDEGMQGLAVHLVNDTRADVEAVLRLELLARGSVLVADGEAPVDLRAGAVSALPADQLLGRFRDANYVYRFGPPQHDVTVASLRDRDGHLLGQAFHFPLGPNRPTVPDVGLRAEARQGPDGAWELEVSADRLALWVVPAVAGYEPDDAWFHLAPGTPRQLRLTPAAGDDRAPRGTVRAWNAEAPATIRAV